MFKFKKKNVKLDVYTCAAGVLKPLSDVNDNMFSKGMMGPGFAIEPSDEMVYSPVDGEITMIFPTKHAIGIKTAAGTEIILHVGIDTVGLKGLPFEVLIEANTKVKAGTSLLRVDYQAIKDAGLQTDVICVFTNAKDFELIKSTYSVVAKESKVAMCDG